VQQSRGKNSVCPPSSIILLSVSLKSHRAVFNARTASGAAILDDASSAFLDLDFEISRGAFHGLQVRVSDQLDVHMPADLDQFRGDDSHGTVVGGEGLVQLGHDSADRRRFFQQVDVVAGVGQIESRLHAGDSTADHHDRSNNALTHATILLARMGSSEEHISIVVNSEMFQNADNSTQER